ncbi:hypothetical protein ABLU80_16255, partial [Klebsiella sp. CN_Kp104]|uniref:hypothetical protein n=1 Tax=Klebsiella sp. CN_Kp104 TaxID=3153423 RepID=UPI0032B58736
MAGLPVLAGTPFRRSGKAKPLPASCYPAALRLVGLPVLVGTPFCRPGKAKPLPASCYPAALRLV